jgi:hypothetical protein
MTPNEARTTVDSVAVLRTSEHVSRLASYTLSHTRPSASPTAALLAGSARTRATKPVAAEPVAGVVCGTTSDATSGDRYILRAVQVLLLRLRRRVLCGPLPRVPTATLSCIETESINLGTTYTNGQIVKCFNWCERSISVV